MCNRALLNRMNKGLSWFLGRGTGPDGEGGSPYGKLFWTWIVRPARLAAIRKARPTMDTSDASVAIRRPCSTGLAMSSGLCSATVACAAQAIGYPPWNLSSFITAVRTFGASSGAAFPSLVRSPIGPWKHKGLCKPSACQSTTRAPGTWRRDGHTDASAT